MIGETSTELPEEPPIMSSRRSDGGEVNRLDVREIDGEPFDDIMASLEALEPEETLRLVNSFEPEPLYAVLKGRGFEYEATEVSPDEWHIDITHA